MNTQYKRIRKYGKFITTKRKTGGPRYLLDTPTYPLGPVLLGKYDYTVGLKANSTDFLFYRNTTPSGHSFSFAINTTLNPSNSADKTYIIPLSLLYISYDLYIDWGDGNTTVINKNSTITKANLTHTYATAGSYCITIRSDAGEMPIFNNKYVSDNGNPSKLISLNTPFMKFDEGTINFTDMSSGFEGCNNLFHINGNLFRFNSQISNFTNTFRGCSSLTYIPDNLFKYPTSSATYVSCFEDCTGIKEIPNDLMINAKPTNLSRMFVNCSGIKSRVNMEKIFGIIPFNGSVPVTNMFNGANNCTGDALEFVKYVNGPTMTDPDRINALYHLTKWDNYYWVDSIWTGFLDQNTNALYTDSTELNWFMVDKDSYLLTE